MNVCIYVIGRINEKPQQTGLLPFAIIKAHQYVVQIQLTCSPPAQTATAQ